MPYAQSAIVAWVRRSLLWRAFTHYRRRDGPVHAAAIAYAALLSLAPLALTFTTITGLLLRDRLTPDAAADLILTQLPPSSAPLRPLLTELLARQAARSSGPLALVSLALSLWSASLLGAALRRGLQAIVMPEQRSSFLRERTGAVLVTVAGILVALLWLVLAAVASGILAGLPPLWRGSVGLLNSALLFFLLYRFVMPGPRPERAALLHGIVVSTLAWEGAKLALATAAEWIGGGSAISGALGATVALLLAANLAASITLYGAAIITCRRAAGRSELPNSALERSSR